MSDFGQVCVYVCTALFVFCNEAEIQVTLSRLICISTAALWSHKHDACLLYDTLYLQERNLQTNITDY